MRLQRLNLTRYGKFTGFSIDFGERAAGRPDLHIVYGQNEAGKSTALAGFLDLLFGIERQSRFDFIHPYDTMQIGASLEFAGGVHDFVRIKRARNDLRNAAGDPVAEIMIASQLGGVGRDSYRAMFSLDDDTLEAGGESILASRGDLGQLLFSASTGLADIGRNLVNLRAEADGFYRFHARSGELADLKIRLAALKEQRDQIDTAASRYAQLVEDRERTRSQYDDAIAARAAIQSRIDEIRRQVGALPRLTALRAARERLQPLAGLPAAPAGWPEDLPNLQRDEHEILALSKAIDDDFGRREVELEGLVLDDAALLATDRLARLSNDLHPRHLTAEKDIPVRLGEVHEENLKISAILGRIGRDGEPDPSALVLGTATVGVLRDLIEKRSGLDAAIQSAANELAMAEHRHDEAAARLRGVAGDARTDEARLAAITQALTSSDGGDHVARRRIAERSRASKLEELAERLSALRPWAGEADQLAALAVPEPGIIEHWKSSVGAAQIECDRLDGEAQRLGADQTRLAVERAALAGIAGVVTDLDAAKVRTAREAAWAAHRRTLVPDSADAFEAALRHDDIIMNARLNHEADIAKLHQTSVDLARVEADLRIAEERFARATTRLRDMHNEIEDALAPLSLHGFTVARLEVWLRKRAQVLETRVNLRQAERDLREADADSQAVRMKLTKALTAANVVHDVAADTDELRTIAQTALDREAGFKILQADAVDRLRDLKLRKRGVETASENDRVWHTAWLDACSKCWLGEAAKVAVVRETLPALDDLDRALGRRASLLDRIAKMRDDQIAFARDVCAIASAMTGGCDSDAPLDLYRKITDRVNNARGILASRGAKTKELDDVRERRRIMAEKRAIHARRKAEMTGFYQVDALTDVAGKLSDVKEKAELERQIAEARRDILDALRLPSIEPAEIALDNADRSALEAELMELEGRLTDQDQRTQELYSAHSKATDQVDAVGGDGAVAMLEEQRRTTLLDIEDKARRYLRLRAGIVAAEHALRSYRRHHRSSMMARASEAFRMISRDAYSGLTSQPDRDSEVLIALAADGSSKVASELSKGTRFQLYLALRVAGYREFALSHSSVPFIADDIMETFDDFRAEEAIRLLASMADVGQVIYLTHHRHLCDIAQRVCPDIRVHELSAGP
jgi:uncharacterized protein YhaN